MTLRQKLLTLDIIVLLIIAIISLLANELNYQHIIVKYFIPIMLSAYFVGRYIPLKIVKKHMNK